MKLVEVIRTITTSDETMDTAFGFVQQLGKEPIRAKDNSGFVVNLLLVPYMLDAIRALEAGVASVEDIDKGMQLGAGYPMGPVYSSRLRRTRHDLQDRGDHVRRVSREALRPAAASEANGHRRDVRTEVRPRIL
jgi:3-hydroxyacyl-CoA dehydrogenase